MRSLIFKIIILFSVIFSFPAVAQNSDLVINGDQVSFSEERGIIEARGSVEVVYREVTLHGDHVVYNTKTERVHADKGFDLRYNGISIEGKVLDYGIKDKIGEAADIFFEYDGIALRGKKIDFTNEKFILKDAFFTSCHLEYPHYHVTAREIILYPKYGWLVAYWGYFWFNRIPIVPMPTYIFDLRAGDKARKNIPPFPEIGSNDEDGFFINERLAWHLRRELSGTYSLSYAAKKGFGGGVAADYIVDDNSMGNARLYGKGSDGMYGGLNHHLYFGEEIKEEARGPFVFFDLPKHRQYEFETALSYHERINYQRVSYYPNLALRSRSGEIAREEAKYDAEFNLGIVSEQNNVRLAEGGGKIRFYWDFPEIGIGDITPALSHDSRYYSNGGEWVKTRGELNLLKIFSERLSLGLGYMRYLGLKGQSPFNFEMYRFNASDRVTSDLFFMIEETGIRIATSYFTDTWQPEDIDYSLFFKLHCYNLMVEYRSLRREFNLGFSLGGR